MELDKEQMKNDIIMITKISLQIDYSNRTKVKEIYDALTDRKILKTSIGNNYLKRLEKLYHGENTDHKCVICGQESGDNPIICKNCLNRIQIVRNETASGKEEVSPTEDKKNLQVEANKGIENGMKLLSEHIKNADKFVSDTAKVVSEKSNKVIQTVNEKSIDKNPISSKNKKWIWVIGILFVCYIISKAFGLDSSINEDDMITLIGQNVSDINKLYGEGKLYDAINAVTYSNGLAVNYDSEDTLKIIYVSIESPNSETLCNISIGDTVNKATDEMNNLEAKIIEEKAAAGYSVEERGYRVYSVDYDGKTMICSVNFQGGVVTRVACYEKE
ncbi:hypothetical protein DFR55_12915 [Herbinix hemicellulosilytica]|uniref:Uncharacterized protein n=1 Tax=Herbinix hemicellulosilytica TaxID=1564487 RepID=A0A0H5SJ30_HERHM|nr:hypothetical protein [Herbinix hemicellulosilytica]RBP57076.1 hypothetical protein DFR55_12915 [Herbinix hemicellulosilytica]CRZ35085.1 hypothetical protein HHT355_1886 [Herbinix hemicellulosilytica]